MRAKLVLGILVAVGAAACGGDGGAATTTTTSAAPTTTDTTVTAAPTTTTQATTTTAETTTTTMDAELLEPLLGQWYILTHSSSSGGWWGHAVLEFSESGAVIRAHGPQRHPTQSTQNSGRFILDGDVLEISMGGYPGCGWDATYRLIWESEDRIRLDVIDDTCPVRVRDFTGSNHPGSEPYLRRTEEAIEDLRQRNIGTRFEWPDED